MPYARDYVGGIDVEIDDEDLLITEDGRIYYQYSGVSYRRPGARKDKERHVSRAHRVDAALLLPLVMRPGSGPGLSDEMIESHVHHAW
jgi:hypothetical protein